MYIKIHIKRPSAAAASASKAYLYLSLSLGGQMANWTDCSDSLHIHFARCRWRRDATRARFLFHSFLFPLHGNAANGIGGACVCMLKCFSTNPRRISVANKTGFLDDRARITSLLRISPFWRNRRRRRPAGRASKFLNSARHPPTTAVSTAAEEVPQSTPPFA